MDSEYEWEDPDRVRGAILTGDALDPELFDVHDDTIAMLEVEDLRGHGMVAVYLDEEQARELIRVLMRTVNRPNL